MNKKTNTLLFLIIATLVNVALLAIFFIVGFVLLSLLLEAFPSMANSQVASALSVLLVFVFAIGLTFLIYNKLVMWANKKFSLEDKLHPIFGRRTKK